MEIETEIAELESQVATLMKRYHETFNENELLRQKLAKQLQETAVSSDKNQKAVTKIKQIISQLRSEINATNTDK